MSIMMDSGPLFAVLNQHQHKKIIATLGQTMKASIVSICGILLLATVGDAYAVTNSALKISTAKQFFKSGHKTRQIEDINCDNQEFVNCLTLGDIQIGSKFAPLRQKLGESWHTFPRSDGSIDEVYPLRIYQHSTVYWVISHKNNRIVAAQLTGNQAPKTILFAGLQLGDHQDLIIDTLGYPEGRRRYGRSSAYIWDYQPLPFTLEIYNKRLYSVRIHQSTKQISIQDIDDNLLAHLIGKNTIPVNQNKDLNISQVAKRVVNNKGEFENIITTVKNVAEQKVKTKVKTLVNDQIAQGAEALTGENETINNAIGKASDKLQQKSEELIDKTGNKINEIGEQYAEQLAEKSSEFISTKTKETIEQLTDKTKQAIDQSTINQKIKTVKNAIAAQFNPEQQEIIDAVEQWTEAWSQKDMPGYFSAYTNTYAPPTSASRNAWQDKREARISKQSWIKLSTAGFNFPKANIVKNNQITVRFWLEYEVPGYKDKTLKSLTMVKTGNRWLIKQEQSLLVNKL